MQVSLHVSLLWICDRYSGPNLNDHPLAFKKETKKLNANFIKVFCSSKYGTANRKYLLNLRTLRGPKICLSPIVVVGLKYVLHVQCTCSLMMYWDFSKLFLEPNLSRIPNGFWKVTYIFPKREWKCPIWNEGNFQSLLILNTQRSLTFKDDCYSGIL